MKFLKRLFSTNKPFVGDFIETGDELLSLIASNKIAAAEFEDFERRIKEMQNKEEIGKEAVHSADALSGYGISVSAKAFIEASGR